MIKVTHTAPQKPSSHKPHRIGEGAEGEAGGGREGGGGVRKVEVLLFASFLFFFYLSRFLFYFTPLLFAVFVFLPSLVPSNAAAHRRYDTVIKVFLHQASVTCCWLSFYLFIYFFFCPRWLKKVLSFFMRSLSLDHRRSEGSPVICCSRPKELTWPGSGGWGFAVSGGRRGGGGLLYSHI